MPGCSAAIIASSNKVGSLGFKGTSCCVGDCPAFPLQHVVICFEVNNSTTVNIEASCPTACGDNTTDPTTTSYPIGWTGISESSWGRSTRIVRFDQYVQSGSFIRITTCPNVGSCASGADCGLGAPVIVGEDTTHPHAPKLLQFRIDGQDIVTYLQAVLTSGDQDGCVYVGCADRDAAQDACCQSLADLNEIPWGTEILVGPIGERVWVLGCPNILVTEQPQNAAIVDTDAFVTFSVVAEAVRFVDPALTYFWEVREMPSAIWTPYVSNSIVPSPSSSIFSALTDTLTITPNSVFSVGIWQFRCNIYSTIGNSAVVSAIAQLTVTAAT